MRDQALRARTAAVVAAAVVATFVLVGSSARLGPSANAADLRAAAPGSGQVGPFVRGHVLVRYRVGATAAAEGAVERRVNGRAVSEIRDIGVRVLSVAAGAEDAAISALLREPAVAAAELDPLATLADVTPNDPYWPSQSSTSLAQVHASAGWSITTGASGPIVADVDTGVDFAHPDLAGKLLSTGWDFVHNDANPADDNGHGTLVAGIIGAESNNATGIAGLCWGCQILPVKALDSTGSGSYSNIASAITYATDHGAKVINLSLGGSTSSSTMQSAVNYAVSKGVVVAAAAGNNGCACVLYPAAYPNVIAVGAVDKYNVVTTYSNTGPELDLVAPGTNWSTSMSGSTGYAAFAGTSSATPVVAALAALALSLDSSLSPPDVATALESHAQDLGAAGFDQTYGWGLVDNAATLTALAGGPAPSPSATPSPSPGPTTSPSPSPSPTPTPQPSPTPAPTASPSPTPAPTPSASPSPTAPPSPSPTPTPSASTASSTFSGSLNAKQPSRSFSVTVGTGPLSATATSNGASVQVAIVGPDGSTLATTQGTSASLVTTLLAGTYAIVVSDGGAKANFKLTATYATP